MNSRIDYPERGAVEPDVPVLTRTPIVEPSPESAVSWGAILAGAAAAAALSLTLLILGMGLGLSSVSPCRSMAYPRKPSAGAALPG